MCLLQTPMCAGGKPLLSHFLEVPSLPLNEAWRSDYAHQHARIILSRHTSRRLWLYHPWFLQPSGMDIATWLHIYG